MFYKSMHFFWLIGCFLMFIVGVTALQFFWHIVFTYLVVFGMLGFTVTLVLAGKKYAPRPFNNYATWFAVICVGIVGFHAIGQDDKWLLITLLGADQLFLNTIQHSSFEPYTTANDQLTVVAYMIRIVIGALYGAIVDGIVFLWQKRPMIRERT